ncbi:MAG: hypothetical protein LRY75_22215, partial [Shewanella xiamenensis]|nr:hypothetical protein [Shewanella xiamenensis]
MKTSMQISAIGTEPSFGSETFLSKNEFGEEQWLAHFGRTSSGLDRCYLIGTTWLLFILAISSRSSA